MSGEGMAAAGTGRRLKMFVAPGLGPNAALAGGTVVRNRTRDQVRNNPWILALLDRTVSNAVGTGIQGKGLYGTPEFRKRDRKLWKRFCKRIDADGVLNFDGLQALAWREFEEAGEVFVRQRSRRPSDGLPVPLQVQLIESEQCPSDYYSIAPNGNQIRAGIEFNLIGRRVAYWMYGAHPGDTWSGQVDAGQLRRIPAEQIQHIYRPIRAGQLRGIPRLSTALVKAFSLDKLDDAVLHRQQIANLFTGWYLRDPGGDTDDESVQEGMTDGETDDDGTPLAGMEPGTMQELPAGVKPEFNEPPSPGTDYAEFMRSGLMAVAAAGGVPYEVLTGDLRGISDRALRLILNEFRRRIEQDQWVYFIPQFCQPIREAYLDAAVLSGALEVPGYADIRDDVSETLWVPQGWPWSHPVQDVTAERNAVRAGFRSRSAVQLSAGEDPEQVELEIKGDNERADRDGFVFDSDPRKTSAAGLTQARPQGTVLPPTEVEGSTQ